MDLNRRYKGVFASNSSFKLLCDCLAEQNTSYFMNEMFKVLKLINKGGDNYFYNVKSVLEWCLFVNNPFVEKTSKERISNALSGELEKFAIRKEELESRSDDSELLKLESDSQKLQNEIDLKRDDYNKAEQKLAEARAKYLKELGIKCPVEAVIMGVMTKDEAKASLAENSRLVHRLLYDGFDDRCVRPFWKQWDGFNLKEIDKGKYRPKAISGYVLRALLATSIDSDLDLSKCGITLSGEEELKRLEAKIPMVKEKLREIISICDGIVIEDKRKRART